MTVPSMPDKIDGITYYIWTDIFFGDMGYGRMNQFVPQLILGTALDNSSGPPHYNPQWGNHKSWAFGAHYFFEAYNATSNQTQAYAAYGKMFPATAGETLFTTFSAELPTISGGESAAGPVWTLEMGVVGDPLRLSSLKVAQPYMGIGRDWPIPTVSWAELNYSNMCINACWELYGANDRAHLPGNGSKYDILIERPASLKFDWVTKWDEDEGAQKTCPTSTIKEQHNSEIQHVEWDIFFPGSSTL